MSKQYHLVVVPDSGPSVCGSYDSIDPLTANLREAVNRGDCAVYVFYGDRFHVSTPPHHLLHDSGTIPLFDAPGELKPAESEFVSARGMPSPFTAVPLPPALPKVAPQTDDWDDDFDEDDD